ncbi:energy transducer TonB [Neolewinella lacunae]|uniref:Energy transducer TonB n=1 Tax=Neolewinella lacunae TaxID=1517758 RepID=A0A923PLM5_9BACT|nr:energy transducer TonB [Neolewinella lacunae]MBC6994700.1 energy transducer TonB [Neolewinella lacunae]MDN3634572.1 energy transducer TonB [Neolewinella lacunae]
MAKNKITHVAKPIYPGGLAALRKFVSSHLTYPLEALAAKVEGTVTVRYSLDYRGVVVDAKIKQGLGHGCDEEALRVTRLLRFTVPQDRKKKVRIHQDLNVHFKLPKPTKKAPTPPATAVQITYTTTASAAKKSPEAGSGYQYQIEW